MRGVEPQPVSSILVQPHTGVVEKEIAHFSLPVRWYAAEGGVPSPLEVDSTIDLPSVVLPVVVLVDGGVVVDHVEDHGEPPAMALVDEPAHVVGPPEIAFGSEAVGGRVAHMALVGGARALSQGKQRNAVEPEPADVAQLGDDLLACR